MRATRYHFISIGFLAAITALSLSADPALPGGKEASRQAPQNKDHSAPFPKYTGRVPLGERIKDTKEVTGDLLGNIAADRPLTLADMDYILRLSQYLINKRNDRREPAAQWLGRFGHRLAIPALLAVLRDETDNTDVRQRCVTALSSIRDKRVVDFLIEDGLGADEINIRYETCWNLMQLVGYPPQLKDKSYISGFKPPPKDPQEREEYLQIWRRWWKNNRDDLTLHRGGRHEY